jgi:hypothetical protein
MTKINIGTDCGNSPRKIFLKDLMVAMAKGDLNFVSENISENINWEIPGEGNSSGKENYLKKVAEHKIWKVNELVVDAIITHGPDASVSGFIKTNNNSVYSFCNIYKFKSAGGTTINAVKTFLIKH